VTWRLGLIGLSAGICWLLAGRWEWNVPPKWTGALLAVLSRWRRTWPVAHCSFRLDAADADLEHSLWRLRRNLPGLETELRSLVAVDVELCGEILPAAKEVIASCQRRYPGIQVGNPEEQEA